MLVSGVGFLGFAFSCRGGRVGYVGGCDVGRYVERSLGLGDIVGNEKKGVLG